MSLRFQSTQAQKFNRLLVVHLIKSRQPLRNETKQLRQLEIHHIRFRTTQLNDHVSQKTQM